jgi:hypothetical protein
MNQPLRPMPPSPPNSWAYLDANSTDDEVAAADAEHDAWLKSPEGVAYLAWDKEVYTYANAHKISDREAMTQLGYIDNTPDCDDDYFSEDTKRKIQLGIAHCDLGLLIDGEEVEAWFEALETNPDAPSPTVPKAKLVEARKILGLPDDALITDDVVLAWFDAQETHRVGQSSL